MTIYAQGSHILTEDQPISGNTTTIRYGFDHDGFQTFPQSQQMTVEGELRESAAGTYERFAEFGFLTEPSFDEDGNLLTQTFIKVDIPDGNARQIRLTLTNPGPDDVDLTFFVDEIEKATGTTRGPGNRGQGNS